jgi:hypothetical protein
LTRVADDLLRLRMLFPLETFVFPKT